MWPSVISVKLSSVPTIYVDASHGPCRQKAAADHELEHVAIDHRLVDRYVPIFQRRVADMAAAIGTVAAPSEDGLPAVRQRIEDKIGAVLSVTYDAMAAERAAAHRAHDSPDEYRRVGMACGPYPVGAPDPKPGR